MKFFFIGMSLLSVTLVQAGSGVGNGGVSVVCRDNDDKITTAELLDIYEGKVRFGKKYNNDLDADTKIELAQLKLVKHPDFLVSFQEELAKVRAILTYIPEGHILTPTNDAFPTISRKGCDFEQLANYTSDGQLLVSEEIYDHLSEVDRAALLVHEAVYALFRNEGAKDSIETRKLTAELLAQNANQAVIDQILNSTFENTVDTCGMKGTVEERINDCKNGEGNFVLVAKTKEDFRVYKDVITGLLWGDRLTNNMNYYQAMEACNSNLKEVAYIKGVEWRLPTIYEFREAEKSGIRYFLPGMNHTYWSSTERNSTDANYSTNISAYQFGSKQFYVSVRCVARTK